MDQAEKCIRLAKTLGNISFLGGTACLGAAIAESIEGLDPAMDAGLLIGLVAGVCVLIWDRYTSK